ncbi:hypothetical protein SAMN04489740_3127 [Arthrobacter alpinus]|uniref:Uncharacterized protein n=1 Tax=Arthrobacter alpinus TaxID=656366 RepID=A0A1H5MUV8_9MICC|nr:hypothetical protein SAMN04489740_3127 [Arthrobacter alpinus]
MAIVDSALPDSGMWRNEHTTTTAKWYKTWCVLANNTGTQPQLSRYIYSYELW